MTVEPPQGDPDTSLTLVVGVVGSILLFVIVVGLTALYQRAELSEVQDKLVNDKPGEVALLEAEQVKDLGSWRWVDAKNGRVAIPIEHAMALVVEDLAEPPAPEDTGTPEPPESPEGAAPGASLPAVQAPPAPADPVGAAP